MSTAPQEPRRADSSSGSKVTPRRNAAETSTPGGLQYDSDELPVLIRLPNLRELSAVEKPKASGTKKKRPRLDRTSEGKPPATTQNTSKVGKKTIPQQTGKNKLLIGGIVGGISVVALLLLFNAGSPQPPADEDGWASEAAALEMPVQEPDFSFASQIEPPPPAPDFVGEAAEPETAQFASGEFETSELNVPVRTSPEPQQADTAAWPSQTAPVDGWPSDEAMGLQSAPDLWPGESVSLEQGGYEYPPTDSPSQTDYRSSMYPPETESVRMGKLDSDRPVEGDYRSILNGNIEIPDTTSLR